MRVSCTECGVTLESSYLKQKMASLHGICAPHMRGVDEEGGETTTYVVSFPRILQSVRCPVPGCPVVEHSAGRLREHFMYRNFWSQVEVFQEGKEPPPWCNLC